MSARCFSLRLCPLHYLAKEHNTPKLISCQWHQKVMLIVQHWTARSICKLDHDKQLFLQKGAGTAMLNKYRNRNKGGVCIHGREL